jgi:hypothetical protein
MSLQCAPATLCLTPLGLRCAPPSLVLVTLAGTNSHHLRHSARCLDSSSDAMQALQRQGAGRGPLLRQRRMWPGPSFGGSAQGQPWRRRCAAPGLVATSGAHISKDGARGSSDKRLRHADPASSGRGACRWARRTYAASINLNLQSWTGCLPSKIIFARV